MAAVFRTGREAHLSIVYGGTTYDLSSGVEDGNMGRTVEAVEVTTYGDDDKVYIPGLGDGDFSFTLNLATTYEDVLAPTIQAATNPVIQFGPHGSDTGRTKYTRSVVVTSIGVGAPVGDAAKFDFACQGSGALTSTKWA